MITVKNPIIRWSPAWVATMLTGLSAGFFATYQYSVTRALTSVDDETYVVVFQAINASIRSPEFGVIFFGSLMALVTALTAYGRGRSGWLWILAVVAYGLTLVITFMFNIPLNEALAVVDSGSVDAVATGRASFEVDWNRYHLIRTLCAVLAFLFCVAALSRVILGDQDKRV